MPPSPFDEAFALYQAGKAGEAERLCRRLLDSAADDFAALQLMGAIQVQLNRPDQALACFDRAASLRPGFAILTNRGAVLQMLGRVEEALGDYDRALGLESGNAVLFYNRGRALQDLGRLEEALGDYRKALALDPHYALAFNNAGNVLRVLKRDGEALAVYDRALALRPDYAEALYNRANLQWSQMGNFPAALRDMEKLLQVNPAYDYALGELVYLRMRGGDWRDLETLRARIDQGVREGRRVVQPFHYQALSDSPADLLACAEIYTRHYYPSVPPMARSAPRTAKKIRLGYQAGEFRAHATSWLMAGLFEAHDREKFELVAFDNGWDDKSPIRARLDAAFDRIVDISRLPDRAASEAIAEAGIDILVNLNGYVGLNRAGIYARRPAPIQVNYLGSPATMGADFMDYIIADRILIPEGEEKFYREKTVILPDSYQVNDTKRTPPGVAPSRAACGLPEDGFVFCSFNSSYKLTPDVFAAWMAILKAAPNSVLWLLENNPEFAANMRRAAVAAGMAAERLIFAPVREPQEHLTRMQLADLFLDLLPCGGHTTASDALWAGVPLLTCKGHAFGGRVAASVLHAVGLPELVVENLSDYQALALRLAGEPQALKALRGKLAANRLTMPLFDTARFTRHIEAAYLGMWDRQLRGLAPEGFAVPGMDKTP